MPYSGSDVADLPSSVQKLPKSLRDLWVRVFNENYDAADEGKAHKLAWGAVRRVQTAKKARLLQDVDLGELRAYFEAAGNKVPKNLVVEFEFKTIDQPDGLTRWTMISSGAFRDRDGQIVSSDYLRNALEFADKHGYHGALNIWHIPGSDIGACDTQELIGQPPVLLESGVFHNTPAGRAAATYYRKHASDMGGSLEFLFNADRLTETGVYEPPGVIVKRSVLPRAKAAFQWSALGLKESNMAKTRPEQIAHLATVLGITEDDATKMVEHLEAGTKTLADYGVDWKETDAPQSDEPAPEQSAKEAEVVAEPPAPVEAIVEAIAEVSEETVAEVEEPESDAHEAGELEVILPPETVNVLANQVMSMVDATLNDLRQAVADIATLVQSLSAQQTAQIAAQKEIETAVKALQTTDEAKISAAVQNLPRATVKMLQQTVERPTERQAEKLDTPEESMLARAKATLYG